MSSSFNISQETAIPSPLKVGHTAPDFTLNGQTGPLSLHDFSKKANVVLFFYPKDGTPKCTAEACAFRDNYAVFQQSGAVVLGISSDSETSHASFVEQQRLPYPLLSDPDGKIRRLYGVPKTLGIIPGRVTYVIDKQSIVRHIFSSQTDVDRHISDALAVLKLLA